MAEPRIRPFREGDESHVFDVCVRTGQGDPAILADVYAAPYLRFDPSLAWVVDEGAGAEGYIIATADSADFERFYRDEWVRGVEHDPLIAEVDDYPAHLHIDLLPRVQGSGYGRALIEVLVTELRARGIRGLHLRMDPTNIGAKAFYLRIGFAELSSSSPENPVLGRRLD